MYLDIKINGCKNAHFVDLILVFSVHTNHTQKYDRYSNCPLIFINRLNDLAHKNMACITIREFTYK